MLRSVIRFGQMCVRFFFFHFHFPGIRHAITFQSFTRGGWNWPISCLNDSQTQERGRQGVKFTGNMSRILLEACAFGVRSGNRSVFILDPRLITRCTEFKKGKLNESNNFLFKFQVHSLSLIHPLN